MPRLKRRVRRDRHEWTLAHFSQLASGWDYFGAWGCLAQLPIGERDAWPDAATLEDMRLCFEAHRSEVIELARSRRIEKSWAEAVFDDGVSPQDAF